jgi:enoyl-CoA hydratase/carnithine racemase
MSETIHYRREGAIGVLTLARPAKLNAMTDAMGDAIRALVPQLNADPELRCLLVTGEGRAFSAGGDLDFLEENSRKAPQENEPTMLAFYQKFLSIREVAVPTIALLQGRATGAGLCFALGCDMRLAADDALLSVNFARVGLTPGMGGTWSLERLVGPARAAELFFTGRTVSAAEAAAMGLVNGAYPAERLFEVGMSLACQIAEAAPGAIKATKGLLRANATRSLHDALAAEASVQAQAFASEDLKEGIAAIRERRSAWFTGQ